ncbi:MAG: DUF255 domain-containing protein [Comamonadaceae bacterium]|nr:DUF255 domain-containing protein [Comamonadaceae bacterium]
MGNVAAADATSQTAAATAADPSRGGNRLVDSANPYLLLHVRNPVDWYPWGPEALDKARRENKPIFISVGYSTCYWCHVAERTIYSNPDIAKLMNLWFVNIKIDREERPDLDEIYMLATQLMTGHGGWPNNVFLTPDLKPFHAGSYFPPADDEFGRPGFTTILRALHEEWTAHPERLRERADLVAAAMHNVQEQRASAASSTSQPADLLAQARDAFLKRLDTKYGGFRFGDDPTKFPHEPILDLLIADYRANRTRTSLDALTRTLDAMAAGGIYDHLAGGFHRYSVEPTLVDPAFREDALRQRPVGGDLYRRLPAQP